MRRQHSKRRLSEPCISSDWKCRLASHSKFRPSCINLSSKSLSTLIFWRILKFAWTCGYTTTKQWSSDC